MKKYRILSKVILTICLPLGSSSSLAFSNHFFFTSTLNASKVSIPNKLTHTKTYVSFTNGINLVLIRYVLPHPHSPDSIRVPTGLFPISNTISQKKVILVFDDLERSNISSTDLLGCINDYCENQRKF